MLEMIAVMVEYCALMVIFACFAIACIWNMVNNAHTVFGYILMGVIATVSVAAVVAMIVVLIVLL